MRFILPTIALGILSACASTGVVPMDRDSFMISKTSPACGFRTAAATRAELYQEANQFCSARRQQVSTISSTGQDGIIGARCASAELVFRCVEPGVMDASEAERVRRDAQQDRRSNQIDQATTPRMVFTPPPPPLRVAPTTTDCTRFANTVSCSTR